MGSTRLIAIVAASSAVSFPACAGPFASAVLGYEQGSNAALDFTDPSTALGSAERFTGEGQFPSGVTPFNPAFGRNEIVSIGSGGSLTLGFDALITDSAAHAYGVDLIVFSNAGFADASYSDADPDNNGSGLTGGNPFLFGAGGTATIQVSEDGDTWFTAAIRNLDLFPTLGYADFTGPTPDSIGSVETDFTLALDPALTLGDFANLSFVELMAIYGGSGGGVGIDISSSGLESASYVRFLNESDEAFEIDAVAVVPAPGGLALLSSVSVVFSRRRRRGMIRA